MSTPFIGEIRIFAGNYAPRGFAVCGGQLMAISQNEPLFNLIGTTYGGDGQQTFALPDLVGRTPISQGQGPGLSVRTIGEQGGSTTVTLLTAQLPSHTHGVFATNNAASLGTPTGNLWAREGSGSTGSYSSTSNGQMAPSAILAAGGSQPHNNMQPYLVLTYIIALEGIFPSRN